MDKVIAVLSIIEGKDATKKKKRIGNLIVNMQDAGIGKINTLFEIPTDSVLWKELEPLIKQTVKLKFDDIKAQNKKKISKKRQTKRNVV